MTAASFLNSNQAPPNVLPEDVDRLKSKNHMESKKFFIVMTSVAIISFFYFVSVGILFVIPQVPETIAGYITLFSKTIEILAIVIAFYVSAQAAVDLKYGSSSNSSLASQADTNTEVIKQEVTVIHTNAKEEDYELS